jgi:hypothetical protein
MFFILSINKVKPTTKGSAENSTLRTQHGYMGKYSTPNYNKNKTTINEENANKMTAD